MIPHSQNYSRRAFLAHSLAAGSALGVGVALGRNLFADRTQIAARIQQAPSTHPLVPALKLGTECLAALDQVEDYQAILTKRVQTDRKLRDARMELKLREQPFSVYLKFLQPSAGREVLFVAGQNDDKLLVHDVGLAGLVGTISLDPHGSYAMADNRHPITKIGMRNMAAALLEQWLDEISSDDLTVNFYPNARIGKTACKAVETSHRTRQSGAEFQMTRLYIDNEHGWPIRVQQYDFPGRRETQPVLVEDYLYSDVRVNTGLTDVDFSTKNPKYRF